MIIHSLSYSALRPPMNGEAFCTFNFSFFFFVENMLVVHKRDPHWLCAIQIPKVSQRQDLSC